MRNFDIQEQRNKTYTNDIRELHVECRQIKEHYMETTVAGEMMSQYAPKEELNNVKDQVAVMPTTSKMEMRFKQIQIELDNMMKKVSELHVRRKEWEASNRQLRSDIEEVYLSKKDFKTNWTAVQKRLEQSDKKNQQTMKTVEGNTERLDTLRRNIDKKAEKEVVDHIESQLTTYAKYEEMKALYHKVLPQMQKFEETMQRFDKEHEQSKEMIKRYDEVIAQKANRTQIIDVEKKAFERYAKKELTRQTFDDHEEKLRSLRQDYMELESTVKSQNLTLSKSINAAVTKATKSLESFVARKPIRQTWNVNNIQASQESVKTLPESITRVDSP